MHSSHQTLNDSVLLVDNLSHGSEAVGGTGGVGNDISTSVVLGMVNTNDEHGSIGGGGRDDNLFGSTSKMGLRYSRAKRYYEMRGYVDSFETRLGRGQELVYFANLSGTM